MGEAAAHPLKANPRCRSAEGRSIPLSLIPRNLSRAPGIPVPNTYYTLAPRKGRGSGQSWDGKEGGSRIGGRLAGIRTGFTACQ